MNRAFLSFRSVKASLRTAVAASLVLCAFATAPAANLADQPVFATSEVPGNLALALSVEWPTANRMAHTDGYTSTAEFLGYFDPKKCYLYYTDTTANSTNTGDSSYFYPAGIATNHVCTGTNDTMWSGNFLNWAATPTIDPFRWAMTGGRRVVDTATTTVLEKAWSTNQGLFPDRDLTVAAIAGATPFNGTRVGVHVQNMGFKMRLTVEGDTVRTLTANYYNGKDPTQGKPIWTVSKDDAYHDWGNSSPGGTVPVDNFSVEMTGTFKAPESGDYEFQTISDDGVRLWVKKGTGNFSSGDLRIDNWTDHGSTTDTAAKISMNAGDTFKVQLRYYDAGGGAVMQLLWKTPTSGSFSAFNGGQGTKDYTMRVKVCDPSAPGGVEPNCTKYGGNYKPEGLIQKYSQKMRFSAFGYLNDTSDQRDGGVLRANQKFVGPKAPVPGQAPATNAQTEWSATDGTFVRNPDAADALATTTDTGVTISDSGVMNYLNQFGQLIPGDYKNYDPVSELYYAVIRYYKNLGNVSTWSAMGDANTATKTRWLDGFPVIRNWSDPLQYSCQRNFVLGIGDIYTHVDKDVAGNTTYRDREPAMPPEITADDTVNAIDATNRVGTLQGLGNIGSTDSYSGRANSAYIAGLAFDSNTKDIRPDVTGTAKTIGKQTVQTYWVDVLEQSFERNNQFYLAAKFGGMKVPDDFDPYTFAGTIPLDWWSTSGDTLTDTRNNTTQNRPDNYFAAGKPDTMVAGLTKAFENIANAIKAYTTSFSLSTAQVSSTGSVAYASQFDASDWSGVITARQLTFAADDPDTPEDETGKPSSVDAWNTKTKMAAQFAGTNWNANRRIATWNPTTSAGVPFRSGTGGITATQLAALDPTYVSGDDSANYLNYLRGDQSNEVGVAGGTQAYRKRTSLLGDIVDAKLTPVGPPSLPLGDTNNPGYSAFKAAKSTRKTVVYAGANDGMLHAFDGSTTDTTAGQELFAYIPSAMFSGPDNTPQVSGLAQLGSPNYVHHFYVDATPLAFDIDMNFAGGTKTTVAPGTNADWRTVLIGGLGKGGRSYYALDVTNPGTMTTEAAVASKVLWEFTDTTMGFSFGAPIVVKTAQYGWVAIFTSGYNAPQGQGYLYVVNPRDGTLLQKISTGISADGLTQASAYVQDYANYVADSVYVGDLDGNLWRFDLTAKTGNYPTPTRLATLTDGTPPATGNAQPITTAPLIEISPSTRQRFVLVGTGRLLASSDINSAAAQSFYGIIDGTAGAFSTVSTPITRADMTNLADLLTGVALPPESKGWYLNLGSTGSVAWRVTSPPTSFNGILAFSSLLTNVDACSPAGQSRVYALNFTTGKSVLDPASAYQSFTNSVTDLRFVSLGGTPLLISGDNKGGITKIGADLKGGASFKQLNWRELPTID